MLQAVVVQYFWTEVEMLGQRETSWVFLLDRLFANDEFRLSGYKDSKEPQAQVNTDPYLLVT